MRGHALPTLGLLLAGTMSAANVFMEVSRKKAVYRRSIIPATFWCQFLEAIMLSAVILIRMALGYRIVIRDGGNLFGMAGVHLSAPATYWIYLAIDTGLLSLANVCFFIALQAGDLSATMPLLSFTSVLLIPAGFIMLGELPPPLKLAGVALIVTGCLVMYRRLFSDGWTAPIRAVFKERGSRYILMVAFLMAISSPLDKKLVMMSDVYVQAFAYSTGMSAFFLIVSFARRDKLAPAISGNMQWVAMAGWLDGTALLLQFASYRYIDVVISISIKRAGIILSVLFGALFFKERDITNKLIGASVMFIGVLIIYLPLSGIQTTGIAALTVACLGVCLYLTREREEKSAHRELERGV